MMRIIPRIHRALFFGILLTISGSAMMGGCEYFPEATFKLADESRLPKWIALPSGLTRADVSITMNYYIKLWGGRSATFILRDKKGQVLKKVAAKLRGLEPLQLKHPPPGFPPDYPAYEVITANGITEIVEHRRGEPIFYVTDDPIVWKELGVQQK